jgi:hypothetical protein
VDKEFDQVKPDILFSVLPMRWFSGSENAC